MNKVIRNIFSEIDTGYRCPYTFDLLSGQVDSHTPSEYVVKFYAFHCFEQNKLDLDRKGWKVKVSDVVLLEDVDALKMHMSTDSTLEYIDTGTDGNDSPHCFFRYYICIPIPEDLWEQILIHQTVAKLSGS